MKLIDNFFTSGYEFKSNEVQLKNRYQMVNVGIVVSSIGLMFGIIGNIIRHIDGFIPVELFIVVVNIIMFVLMRKSKKAFYFVPLIITFLFTFLFLFLIYKSEVESLKFLWVFTYPIIILYFHNTKKGFYWLLIMIVGILVAPLQPFYEVDFSIYQVIYLGFVLALISSIIFFYQIKMSEANTKIIQQQDELKNFNLNLEKQVKEKTSALQVLNDSLELKVKEKIEELRAKDKILEVQSKQAVMGEMISMIAHQWRQPLSTITLQIANLQFKRLLTQDLSADEVDNALSEISDMIIYLSDTVDDFQTYFHPDKEMQDVEIQELLNRAINFTSSRTKKSNIKINITQEYAYIIKTYPNEFVQVILNILNNAIDAHDEQSKENAFINIDVSMQKNIFLIKISDNAGGIKEENLNKLFEPYFSTKGKNGTGLGLYMSQMIVQKQFYGTIDVENSSDGAVFTLRLAKI